MLQPVQKHRHTLSKAGGIAGGLYLVGRYVADRLEEVREKVIQERTARDNLSRRFRQNREDISYTIMALVPTLGQQILAEMDVEGVTAELQTKSRASRHHVPSVPDESSIASSIDVLQDHEGRSDAGSVSVSSFSGSGRESNTGEASPTWVDQFSPRLDPQPRRPSTESGPIPLELGSSQLSQGTNLSESISTTNSALSYGPDGSGRSEGLSSVASDTSARSKAELWKEVKILTFTRTLTILYSTTLLSLFTTIQLTLLARFKYVHSVLQMEQEERFKAGLETQISTTMLLLDRAFNLLDHEDDSTPEQVDLPSEEIEMKFLTLSWWILHVGWKDVGERVRRGVEEVFDGVSLKSKLSAMDLHRLIGDVRRRVEHAITFEGDERRIDFRSTLLSPTTETMQHILIQGGIPPHRATHHTPLFTSLLNETSAIISSSDFARVLEVSLDRATEILFDGLQKNVFVELGSRVDESGQEVRLRLAGLLPGLARWCHLALNGLPNELVDGLMDVREVSGLSAIVFSKFEERFQ